MINISPPNFVFLFLYFLIWVCFFPLTTGYDHMASLLFSSVSSTPLF